MDPYGLCNNYWQSNKITTKNKNSLPKIDDLIDQLHGVYIYIYIFKINLRTSYHQRKVKEVVILKNLLITWNGYYEPSYAFWANWYTWNTYGPDELSNSTLFGKVCYYNYW